MLQILPIDFRIPRINLENPGWCFINNITVDISGFEPHTFVFLIMLIWHLLLTPPLTSFFRLICFCIIKCIIRKGWEICHDLFFTSFREKIVKRETKKVIKKWEKISRRLKITKTIFQRFWKTQENISSRCLRSIVQTKSLQFKFRREILQREKKV